jgi:hypothetical protein
VRSIDVAIENIKQLGAGGEKLAEALRQFTQAVVDEGGLAGKEKEAIVEQLAFLTTQIQTKSTEKKRWVNAAILTVINAAISASNGLVILWQHLHPTLQSLLT